MKNVFLFLSCFLLLSCSSSDDNNPVNSLSVNPPSWTHGTWLIESQGISTGLKFTSSDICSVTLQTSTCHVEQFQVFSQHGSDVSINEPLSSETEYKADFTIDGNTVTYHVKKVSATQMNWINTSGTITLTKK